MMKDRQTDEKLARLREFNRHVEDLQQTDFFYDVFAVSPASITISRLEDGYLVAINDGFSALFGYEPEEAVGRTAAELALDVDAEHRLNIFDRLREGETIRREETSIRTKEGKIRRVLGSFFVIEALGTEYVVSKLVDVTQIYELREKVVQATQAERQRIGQDLHDGVSSQLTGIDMILSSVINELKDEGHSQVEELCRIRELVRESAEDTRRLSHGLNPIRLSKGTLVDALKELAENTNKVSGLSSVYEGVQTVPDLPKDTATQLYWIAQEAVDNARQHANAGRIKIRLETGSDDHLMLSVEDDGHGFSSADIDSGMGLETVRYRSELIGARIDIESDGEKGTTLRCVIPLNQERK